MTGTKIDWEEIHRRLAIVEAAIERGFSSGPEKTRRLLGERAAILAREVEKTAEGGHIEIVEFLLAKEHYAIETRYVREVYPLRDYTPIPCTPPFVLGVMNVRGQIISVIDIKKFFDMPDNGITDLNKVVIVHDAQMEFGILADTVLGVRGVAAAGLQPPLPTLTGAREEFLMGVTGERTIVLDAKRLLADKNIIVHQEA